MAHDLTELRAGATLMRELGVEEWDPASGRVKLFATAPPGPGLDSNAQQAREEAMAEQEGERRMGTYLGAAGGIRPRAVANGIGRTR